VERQRESNPHEQLGKLPGYHYIMPAARRTGRSREAERQRGIAVGGMSRRSGRRSERRAGQGLPPAGRSPASGGTAFSLWRASFQPPAGRAMFALHPPNSLCALPRGLRWQSCLNACGAVLHPSPQLPTTGSGPVAEWQVPRGERRKAAIRSPLCNGSTRPKAGRSREHRRLTAHSRSGRSEVNPHRSQYQISGKIHRHRAYRSALSTPRPSYCCALQ